MKKCVTVVGLVIGLVFAGVIFADEMPDSTEFGAPLVATLDVGCEFLARIADTHGVIIETWLCIAEESDPIPTADPEPVFVVFTIGDRDHVPTATNHP